MAVAEGCNADYPKREKRARSIVFGGRGGGEDACRRYTFINVNDDTPEMKTKIQNKHGHGRTRKSPIHVMLSEIPSRRADHLKIASY